VTIWLDFFGTEIRYIETPEFGRVRIAEAGRGRPQALMLMHGIGGHLEAYSRNVVALAEKFHTVAFDFVGHGLSDKPAGINYVPATYVRQLGQVMDALGIERAHVSGESLGGWIAGEFALHHPERVDHLVLNTAGGIPIVSDKGRADLRDLAELSRKNYGKAPTPDSVRARMQWLVHRSNWHLLTDELIESRLRLYQQPDFQRAAPLIFAALARADSPQSDIPLLDLERLAPATLYLWTRDNPIHDLEAARAACARTRHGELYVMNADAAHWPQYEAADEFNDVVMRFLERGTLKEQAA
jgi:pimeloyl-ACP methyl ester carboxylesterase